MINGELDELDELDALHWTYLWIGHEVVQGRRSFAGSAKRPSEKETIYIYIHGKKQKQMDCLRCSGACFFCEYSMDSYWAACSFLINSGIVRA